MNILIIDDNQPVRTGLKIQLEAMNVATDIIHEANCVSEGLEAIGQLHPDLVFLDVEMPDGTGMDLMNQVGDHNFQLIFITAHNKYAIEAFKFSAIDFLLKPINQPDLEQALERTEIHLQNSVLQEQLKILNENLQGIRQLEKKIVLKDQENIYFVKLSQIIQCEADGPYTRFYLDDGQKIIISKTLKEYDKLLEGFGFFRSHHSHLVNLQKIKKFTKTDGGYLVMEDDSIISVSTRKKDALLQKIQNL